MKTLRLVTTCLICLLISGLLSAQPVMTQDGRVLDANNRIGSRGVNSRYDYSRGFTSQNYITRQVTGLGAFRGRVGYVGQNELSIRVPSSSTLNTFQRQSVGLQDIYRGQTFSPQVYYDRARTVMSPSEIAAGDAAPGTNVPVRSYYTPAIAPRRITSALGDFQRVVKPGESADIITTDIIPTALPKTEKVSSARVLSPAEIKAMQDSASQQFVSIPKRQQDRMDLARQLQLLDEPETPESPARVKQQVDVIPDGSQHIEQAIDKSIETRIDAPTGPKNIDVDIFETVLDTLRKQHAQKRVEKAKAAQEAKKKADEKLDELLEKNLRPEESEFDEGDSFIKVKKSGEIVLFTLAGTQDTTFNRLIRDAEKDFAQGKYYASANQYQLARDINPNNALTSMGLCQAYFAAGEPVTAAEQIEIGMRIFPALMVVKLDLRSKISNQLLESELENLDKILQSKKDPSLMMLSAYLHRSLGHKQKAVQSAKLLSETAGEDKFYQQFAQYIITGRRPMYQD